CAPFGVIARPRIGPAAGIARTADSICTLTDLSALPHTTAALLVWNATASIGPPWANAWSSLPLAMSQTRARPSAAPVTSLALSTLNESDLTGAGCASVSTSLASAAFQTFTVLPAAAPICVKSRLNTAVATGSGRGPNVRATTGGAPAARFQSLTVLSAPA